MHATIESISPQAARQHLSANGELLVCAYDGDQKFQEHRLKGAIPLSQFKSRATTLPKHKEVIFYCACPHDESARAKAEEYHAQGFNAKFLEGGFHAWNDH
jgi:rhodanese-related sulfurtransferase